MIPHKDFDSLYEPEPNSGCFLWTGNLNRNGYGRYYLGGKKYIMAHRFAYERQRGAIPVGLTIDHLCRVRCCVNPIHMEAVTNKVNVLRGVGRIARQARQTLCHRGHPLVHVPIARDVLQACEGEVRPAPSQGARARLGPRGERGQRDAGEGAEELGAVHRGVGGRASGNLGEALTPDTWHPAPRLTPRPTGSRS